MANQNVCLQCGEYFEPPLDKPEVESCSRCLGFKRAALEARKKKPTTMMVQPSSAPVPLPVEESASMTERFSTGPNLLGRYKVFRELPTTAQNQVFLCYDQVLARNVVVKYLTTGTRFEYVEQFKREAKLLASLKHPNIVGVYDSGFDEGRPFIVMEYVEGLDLDRFNTGLGQSKDEGGRIRRILEIVYEICMALDYLHTEGVVHRDLKPNNIMIDKTGRPVLIDFGIAKNIYQTDTGASEDVILGTVVYMSPEQAAGRMQDIDRRSDIYSLGVMMYYLLTGRVPFMAASYEEILEQIQRAQPDSPSRVNPGIDAGLERIILKAMSKDRLKRFQSTREMAIEIEPFVMGPVAEVVRTKVDHGETRRMRLALALNLVAVILITFYLLPRIFPAWGQENGSAGREQVTTSFMEDFGRGVIGEGCVPVSGEVAIRDHKLWLCDGIVMLKESYSTQDDVRIEFDLLPVEGRLPTIRVGTHWSADVTGEKGYYLEFSSDQRASFNLDGVSQSQFPLALPVDRSSRIAVLKVGHQIKIMVNGKILLEIPRVYDPRLSRSGLVGLQALGGAALVDNLSVKYIQYR